MITPPLILFPSFYREWYRRNFTITLLMARVALNNMWKTVSNRYSRKKNNTPNTWGEIKYTPAYRSVLSPLLLIFPGITELSVSSVSSSSDAWWLIWSDLSSGTEISFHSPLETNRNMSCRFELFSLYIFSYDCTENTSERRFTSAGCSPDTPHVGC